ncbi:MAG: RNA methyltransferase [Pseudomonadota bacterium]
MTKHLSIALAHHPVQNKNGDTITSAVTNLDVHDLARAARTYGLDTVFVVTPLEDQARLIGRLVAHWVTGHGAVYNPKRREALEGVQIVESLAAVRAAVTRRHGTAPKMVATAARPPGAVIDYAAFRTLLTDGTPYVLVFGTAWGLSPSFMETADHVLAPIQGPGPYNHLSVRAAAAIILDRLLGDRN